MIDCSAALALMERAFADADAEAAAELRAHVDGCDDCRATYERLLAAEAMLGNASDDDAIALTAGQHELMRAAVLGANAPDDHAAPPARASRLRPAIKRLGWLAAAAAVAGVVGAVVLIARPPDEGGLTIKGGATLHVVVDRDGRRTVHADGDAVRRGDRLAFLYSAPQPRWLVVLGADAAGEVARLYPADEAALGRLPAGVERPLPDGAVARPSGGCEWIVGFFAATRPDVGALRDALARASTRAGPGCALPPISGLGDVAVHAVSFAPGPAP